MRKTIAVIVLALFSLSPATVLAQDANEVVPGGFGLAKAQALLNRLADRAAFGDFCAFAQIQGPAGSFNIQPVITNYMPEEVIVTMIDVFRAKNRESLLIDSVFGFGPSTGGTLVDEYPNGLPGAGPAVLLTTGWGFGESIYFNLDPDTYDDPSYGATVEEMTGTMIMVVYDGARRCAGMLNWNPILNASIGFLRQTSPAP